MKLVVVIAIFFGQWASAAQPVQKFNQDFAKAQSLARQTLSQIRSSHEIAASANFSPNDRIVQFCADHCGCINKHLSANLKKNGFEVRRVLLTGGGIRIRGAPDLGFVGPAVYDYHVATTIRTSGVWYVIDPIILRDARFEPFAQWRTRLLSRPRIEIQTN